MTTSYDLPRPEDVLWPPSVERLTLLSFPITAAYVPYGILCEHGSRTLRRFRPDELAKDLHYAVNVWAHHAIGSFECPCGAFARRSTVMQFIAATPNWMRTIHPPTENADGDLPREPSDRALADDGPRWPARGSKPSGGGRGPRGVEDAGRVRSADA